MVGTGANNTRSGYSSLMCILVDPVVALMGSKRCCVRFLTDFGPKQETLHAATFL